MKLITLLCLTLFLTLSACNKSKDQPKYKTDFVLIISATSPDFVLQGQPINSIVKCGFYSHTADITFLNFDIKEPLPLQFESRAKVF